MRTRQVWKVWKATILFILMCLNIHGAKQTFMVFWFQRGFFSAEKLRRFPISNWLVLGRPIKSLQVGRHSCSPPIENLQVGDCKDWLNIWGRSCMQCCCAGFWCNSWIIQRGMSAGLMSHILICSFKQDASAFPYEREHEREQEREHQQEH